MDFYKKIIKNKDIPGILNEKEYKCVSLQAITNEAVKENNKERLKDLVEEINGHLTDLRSIKDDKDLKNKEKCEKLIHQFEECLVRILNKKPTDNVLTILNQKLEELQHLSNVVIRENKSEELKKLVEKIERNLVVVKEMPEVKDARSTENGEEFLKLVGKYEDLLKMINTHLSAKKRVISEPMSAEVFQNIVQGTAPDQETNQSKQNKVGLNEVEEKLKLMRQKRLNRLSTFVDQQSKLSEQRSRENSPKNSENSNKSPENLSKITESVEIETAIKSIQPSEILKSSPFRPIAREKLVKLPEEKVFPKADERVIKRLEPKVQTGGVPEGNVKVSGSFQSIFVSSPNAAVVTEKPVVTNTVIPGPTPRIREWPKPSDLKREKALKEDDSKTPNRTSNSNMTENMGPVGEHVVSGVRSSFGKGPVTKSFAERQIENAKMQAVTEKPKVQLKPSNSTRTTPPRTPTQIKKIFNSLACVLGNNNKSIEDLPGEFNSPFEQELKAVQLKSTGFDYRLEQAKEKKSDDNSRSNISEELKPEFVKPPNIPPLITRRIQPPPREKTELTKNRVLTNKEFDYYQERMKSMENLDVERDVPIQTSSSQDQIDNTKLGQYENVVIKRSNEKIDTKTKNTQRRLSLDFDSVSVKDKANYVDQQPTDLLITVKRDSNTIPDQSDSRRSFSTFRSSTDSVKNYEENSVENPLYGIIKAHNIIKEKSTVNTNVETVNYGTSEKIIKDVIFNCGSLEDLLKIVNRKELRNITYMDTIKELNILLKEVKKNVEATLDIDESEKENKRFSRYLDDISNIEKTIISFKGFKRDPEYLLIDKQLAKYYVEIDQIRPQSPIDRSEKKCLTERLKAANKDLEEKVTRNEEILRNVLNEQVKMLGEKYRVV